MGKIGEEDTANDQPRVPVRRNTNVAAQNDIRETNNDDDDPPLSPEIWKAIEKKYSGSTTSQQQHLQPRIKKSTSKSPPATKKQQLQNQQKEHQKQKQQHHHSSKSEKNKSDYYDVPPLPQMLEDILSGPDDDRNEKVGLEPSHQPYQRESRRRRQEQEQGIQDDDGCGYLEDLEVEENEFNQLTSHGETMPGAVRINRNGNNGNDDDDEEMNDYYAQHQSSSQRLELAKNRDNVSRRSGKNRKHHINREMATLPQAEHVTAKLLKGQEPDDFRQKAEQDAEKELLSKIVTANLVGNEEELQKQKRLQQKRLGIVVGLLAVLLVGGIVVGVLFAIGILGSESDPDTAPTIDPLTFKNITKAEDLCDNAIDLSPNATSLGFPLVVTGSTLQASSDNSNFNTCGDLRNNGVSGVWYKLVGFGTKLSLNTCFGSSFDTQISVYNGDSCDVAQCVEGNDQRTNCGTDGSHFTFLAEIGQQYLILVQGLRRANGVFTLVIEEVVENGNCSTAATIEDSNPTGLMTLFSSTKFTSVDNSLEHCQEVAITAPGAWFRFLAKETRFVQARLDDLEGAVTVYTGTCNSLSCVVADENGRAMWTATVGVEYFIFVHGSGKVVGDFSLTILPGGLLRPPAFSNNQCILNERLATPSADQEVRTTNSTVYGLVVMDDTPGCGSLLDVRASPSLWYSVIGTGNGILASSCDTESGFIANVAVYDGDCLNLTCIDGGDQNCGDQSSVAWIANDGTEYFILVQGLDGRVGEFNLTLTEVSLESSSACDSPLPVTLDGVATLGSTENGVVDDVGRCTGSVLTSRSVWYSIPGTGGTLVASTCNPNSTSFARFEVYTGMCDSLICVGIESTACGNQMSATWKSEPDQRYLIQIYGSVISPDGEFTLNVEELPENYECEGAEEDLSPGSVVQGSTVLSAQIENTGCSQMNDLGAWYKIDVPVDNTLTLSSCSRITNFETKLTVFQGTSCGTLSCVGTNNGGSCGNGSFITWEASSSQSYFVLVQGADSYENGNFELSLGVENDICDTANGPIVVGGTPVVGSTILATKDQGDLGCFESALAIGGPGVWYSVVGSATLLEASTCFSQTDFDSRISVYEGSCGSLLCVAGNDDGIGCGNAASVIWFAAQGETYYILVHGVEVGEFSLEVYEVENNACDTARQLFLTRASESVVSGGFMSETFVNQCSGLVASEQVGSWYTFAGTGGVVQLDACGANSTSNEEASVSVFKEECANLNCETDSGNECKVEVGTTFGMDYTVYIEANIADLSLPQQFNVDASNDECDSAFGPLKRGDIVRGSNLDASFDNFPPCGEVTIRGPGVWFSLIGTGETMTVFTCSEFTDFDTQITLYTGEDCGRLVCVASRDDNCGTSTWMQHPFIEGARYYLLVSGKPGLSSVGNFELHVQ